MNSELRNDGEVLYVFQLSFDFSAHALVVALTGSKGAANLFCLLCSHTKAPACRRSSHIRALARDQLLQLHTRLWRPLVSC